MKTKLILAGFVVVLSVSVAFKLKDNKRIVEENIYRPDVNKKVLVQADTEFGTIEFLNAVRQRHWRAIVGMRGNRKLQDGRCLKDLYRHAKRGIQVHLNDIDYPLSVSWFWLKRADGKRELRFVASPHPYSGAYLVRLGRSRWAIEGFFKTAKHQFGLHCFEKAPG